MNSVNIIDRVFIMVISLLLMDCTADLSRNISDSNVHPSAWRSGDVARLKRPLLYVLMGSSAYIDHPLADFDISKGVRPYTPYDSVQYIEKGTSLKILRITKSALPNSVGGTTVIACILDGGLAGNQAVLSAGEKPLRYFKGEYFLVPDPEYFDIISRNSQDAP